MTLDFNEEQHEYTIKGKRLISVTQLINKYTEDFDVDKSIESVFSKSIDENIYIGPNRQYLGMTKDQIKNLWDVNRISKSTYGSFIHNQAELIGNGEDKGLKLPELNQVRDFFKKENYEIVAQELQLYSEELCVAGTVDLLLRNKITGKYVIADWKTNVGKDLSERETKFNKYMLSPINNIPCTEYWKYSLQMSIYRYIMETEPKYYKTMEKPINLGNGIIFDEFLPIEFEESFIIHLIGSQDDLKDKFGKRVIYPEMSRITYKKIPTPYMLDEVKNILEDLKKNE